MYNYFDYNPATNRLLKSIAVWIFFSDVHKIPNFFCAVLQTSFMQFDADRSGTVEPHELHQALSAFGKSYGCSHACHVHTSYMYANTYI